MSSESICIGDRIIGPDQPPYIIAELSANHNGSLERAFILPPRWLPWFWEPA